MNIETVRSLTEFMEALTDIVEAKGDNPAAFKKAKLSMISAISTEQDLRDMEFVHACQDFYAAHDRNMARPAQATHASIQSVQPSKAQAEIRKTVPPVSHIVTPGAK